MSKYVLQTTLKGGQLLENSGSSIASDISLETYRGFLAGGSRLYLYESADHNDSTMYFECVILSDGTRAVHTSLYNQSAAQLSGSEISSTSSNNTLVRSSAISMVNNDTYHVRIRTSGGTLTTSYGIVHPRLIEEVESFTPSDQEVNIALYGDEYYAWGAPYNWVELAENGSFFRFDSANWQDDAEFYLEGTFAASTSTEADLELWNSTDNSTVSSSRITTTSTSLARVRSPQLTLTTAKDYSAQGGSDGGDIDHIGEFAYAGLVVKLPNAWKFETHHHAILDPYYNSNHTTFVGYTATRLRWDPTKWDSYTGVYHEASMQAAASQTIYHQLAEWTSATARTEIAATQISTTSTVPVRIRSGDISGDLPGSSVELKEEWKVSGGSTGNILSDNGKLIYAVEANHWYNEDWTYRVKVTIDADEVDADLTDFPVYVDLSTLPSGFHNHVTSDGGDIRVTTGNGFAEVPRELVVYDSGSDTGELYFKAPELSASVDTEFYIYYGNAAADDYAVDATYGGENVWTNGYVGVYHMQATPTSLIVDSTSNDNDMSTNNMDGSNIDTTSPLPGNGYVFNGSNEYATLADNASMDWEEVSVSAFAKTNTLAADGAIFAKNGGGTSEPLLWFDEGVDDFTFGIVTGTSGFINSSSGGSYTARTTGVWYYVQAAYDNVNVVVRVNGTQNFSAAATGGITNTTGNAGIAAEATNTRWLNGGIDELRVQDIGRTTEWMDAELSNMTTPGTFYAIGTEEASSFTVNDARDAEIHGQITTMVDTFYFDASISGPTDPNNVWSSESNAFNGNTSTDSFNSTNGSTSSNYLQGVGTTAYIDGGTIVQVRARVHGSSNNAPTVHASIATDSSHSEILGEATVSGVGNQWGSFTTLSAPTGGWTWEALRELAVRIYSTTEPQNTVTRVELEVTSEIASVRVAEVSGGLSTSDSRSAEISGGYLWHIQRKVNGGSWEDVETGIVIDEITGEFYYTDDQGWSNGDTVCHRVRNVLPFDSNWSNEDCVVYSSGTDTNDARDAEITGSIDITDNRDAEIAGTATDSNTRDAEIHGTDEDLDNRDAEIHGQDIENDSRDAEITGQDSALDTRSAEIVGEDTSDDSRDAEIDGQDSDVDERDAEIHGREPISNNVDAEIHGLDTISDSISAEIHGQNTSTDSSDAEISGVNSASDDIDSEIHGQNDDNDNRSAEIHGTSSDNDERDSEVTGSVDITSSISAEIHGEADISSTIDAEITGSQEATDSRNAEIHGEDSDDDSRSAEITGSQDVNDSSNAEIHGEDTQSDNRPAEIHGEDSESDNRDAEIHGADTANNTIDAEIHGQDDAKNNRLAEIHGTDTANDNRDAEIDGVAGSNSSRDSETHGQDAESDNRDSEIHGQNSDDNDRDAELTGSITVNDDRDAEVHGQATTDSEQDAEIHGQDSANDTRNAEIDGVDTDSDEVDAEITGSIDTSDNRDAEISGTDTDSSEIDSEITGKLDVVDTRDAEIHGQETDSSSRPAELIGATDNVSVVDAEIHGYLEDDSAVAAEIEGAISVVDSRDAEISGTATSSDSHDAEIAGTLDTNDSRSAEINGVNTANDSVSAEITGVDTANDEVDSEVHGQFDDSDSRDAEISGTATDDDSRDAEIHGIEYANDNVDAEISGTDNATSSVNAEINGVDTSTSEQPAEITGSIDSNSNRDSEIEGSLGDNSSRDSEIAGTDSDSNEISAEITGEDSANDSRPAEIVGSIDITNDRSAEINGQDVVTDTHAAEISGTQTDAAERNAEIDGKATSTDNRDAEIYGVEIADNDRNAEIDGTLVSSDVVGAEINGTSAASDSRNAEMRVALKDPYCPDDGPYSNKTGIYTGKTSPYGKKTDIYTAKTNPYTKGPKSC